MRPGACHPGHWKRKVAHPASAERAEATFRDGLAQIAQIEHRQAHIAVQLLHMTPAQVQACGVLRSAEDQHFIASLLASATR